MVDSVWSVVSCSEGLVSTKDMLEGRLERERRRSLWQSTKSPSHHKIITRNVLLKFMADNELVLTIREAWMDDGGVLGRQLVMSSMWHCYQINCDNEQMENSIFFFLLYLHWNFDDVDNDERILQKVLKSFRPSGGIIMRRRHDQETINSKLMFLCLWPGWSCECYFALTITLIAIFKFISLKYYTVSFSTWHLFWFLYDFLLQMWKCHDLSHSTH